MCRRLRGQARSHRSCWCMQRRRTPQIPCGSGLARESGGSVTVNLDVPPSSRASSLPQKRRGDTQYVREIHYPCGSELARESGGSVTVRLDVPPSSRASSLPQKRRGDTQYVREIHYPCGSELARESGGSVMVRLDVPPSSRASSLPQKRRGDATGPQWLEGKNSNRVLQTPAMCSSRSLTARSTSPARQASRISRCSWSARSLPADRLICMRR